MRILITGGTGNVGTPLVARLAEGGHLPGVLLRNPAKKASLPEGAHGIEGDLQKPETLATAFRGFDRLFLLIGLSQDETQQALQAVEAAKRAGMKRIVYMTVHRLEDGLAIPHFATKKPVKEAIAASGLEYTFIEPNNFYQVDYWFRDALLLYGVYPQPIGSVGTNRVDVRDIADASANALTQDGHSGVAYPLVGPDTLSGADVAAIWERHLGRSVKYGGDDLEAWGEQASQAMPAWMVHDLKIMYAHFQKHGLKASAEDFALQAKVLAHAPRPFEYFVAETAKRWKQQEVAGEPGV